MKIKNLIKIAWRALLLNKKRAVLTMLGIIIGISSVVLMVSLGQSSTVIISNQFSGLGTNLIMVSNVRKDVMGVMVGTENMKNMKLKDVDAIRKRARHITKVTPCVTAMEQMVCGSHNYPGVMMGANVDYLDISNSKIDKGRAFTIQEEETAAKVCILGQTVIKTLFPKDENPVGKEVRFGKTPMLVIGTIAEKGKNMTGDDYDDVIIAPYTTVQKRLLNIDYIHMIMASAASEEACDDAVKETQAIMTQMHKIKPDGDPDFEVTSLTQMLNIMGSIMAVLSAFLVAIAAISLVVGGIGIMNIMYVTVTERTREIGLRRSLGAKNKDILRQFLFESAILSLAGGIIGIIVGLLLSALVLFALDMGFMVSITAIVVSFMVCATIGIFFGWYPAKKAAALDPITALRYE
ncbi:MAG: Macrolide export ATP-binding/permease protein MacB [Candidatus Ordinivivax streblomastigis]|uniref:Macrolide export ATP-binding/permease protein MacB n=1 Tax=Candidatus Ordinivivax streblomastigis TaxID=2540710 RepID=A0A5M8P2B5_9BACT|nr:MAG: Macrolide export ATP-binding/permease protein MacB [Candidatus Ordinivivax streblomastigis]